MTQIVCRQNISSSSTFESNANNVLVEARGFIKYLVVCQTITIILYLASENTEQSTMKYNLQSSMKVYAVFSDNIV